MNKAPYSKEYIPPASVLQVKIALPGEHPEQPGRIALIDTGADGTFVRNRLKIQAVVLNARAFLEVQKEFGSFDRYIWQFVGTTICYAFMQAVGMVNDHTVDCFRYKEIG